LNISLRGDLKRGEGDKVDLCRLSVKEPHEGIIGMITRRGGEKSNRDPHPAKRRNWRGKTSKGDENRLERKKGLPRFWGRESCKETTTRNALRLPGKKKKGAHASA